MSGQTAVKKIQPFNEGIAVLYILLTVSVILIVKRGRNPVFAIKKVKKFIGRHLTGEGIDYTHPAFRNPDGTTRILSIWDQTENEPDLLQYGRYGHIYTQRDINQALQAENPYDIVPQRDENGHGTFMAGIAAGSAGDDGGFTGAAPESSLIVVKLKPAKQ